jgi:hypothetical protein
VRDLLHRIYYAQRAYRERHGAWAGSLAALGLEGLRRPGLLAPPRLEVTSGLFEANAVIRGPGGRAQRWHIRSDARVWADGEKEAKPRAEEP